MAITQFYSWNTGDTITAARLNGNITNILDGGIGNYDSEHNVSGSHSSLTTTGTITCASGITITAGGMTITAGDLTMTTGSLTLSNGGITVTSGNITITSGNLTLTGDLTLNGVNVSAAMVPIGSIIPFYDVSAQLNFNSSNWAYCDGSSATIGGVSANLPDLSNRYLVGFGTEGGGNIDTATWATAAVGNATHSIDVSHNHAPGTLQFQVGKNIAQANPVFRGFTSGGSETDVVTSGDRDTGGSVAATGIVRNINQTIYTASGTGTTADGLSATQSIQPRSIRVRFIMRIT
jgi:hypothetical protein